MKVIFRNSTLERQDVVMTTIEKSSSSVNGIAIKSFDEIRSYKSIKIRVTITNIGSWDSDTMRFSLGYGDTAVESSLESFIGQRVECNSEVGEIISITQTFNFADISTYPSGKSLKLAIVASDYTSTQNAKTVLYKIDYAFI